MRNPKTILFAGLWLMCVASFCLGQESREASKNIKPDVQTCGLHDSKELETFLDKVLAERMAKYNVPGAVFVLVKDGKIFLMKGWGYADLEKQQPVFPQQTIVRAYSVSKSFTATAVMQLVERGKLSLDEDVNKYLRLFKLKESFPQPVTLAHLMTHTAGIVDTGNDTLLARGKLRAVTLGEWLAEYLPPQSKPQGAEVKYSNFGASLAGYIVEVASGEPYATYMQKHVLTPLGMRDSSFLWPSQLSPQLRSRVAPGYVTEKNGSLRRMTAEEGDFANTPAANLMTTAPDIARFMIAHLQGGRYGKARILRESSVQRMHEPWKYQESDKSVGYGFFWRPVKNQSFSFLFHSGGWDGSISDMELLPAYNLGYFLWYNQGGDENRRMRAELYMQFVQHYFSGCSPNSPTKEKAP
jgi:CubicO group peptidase (beta-lactamase class C family)